VYGLVSAVSVPLTAGGQFSYSAVATVHVAAAWNDTLPPIINVQTAVRIGEVYRFAVGEYHLLYLNAVGGTARYGTGPCSSNEFVSDDPRMEQELRIAFGTPSATYSVPSFGDERGPSVK
jgi:hypothetical protein